MELQPLKKIQATIKTVLDGDTIILTHNGQEFTSRARWIDTPETKKPWQNSDDPNILKHWEWGKKAKEFLLNLLKNSQTLTIIPIELDQYNRHVCDWYLDKATLSNNIQIQLCAAGLSANSLPWQQYDFPSRDLSLYLNILKSCAGAYKKKAGFWIEPDFMLPHEFKKLSL